MPTSVTIAWLKACSLVLCILGGVGLALGAFAPLSAPAQLFADVAFWPIDGLPIISTPATRFFAAIGGGGFAAWGVMLWLTASRGFASDPTLARTMIVSSALTWFTVDSIGSVLAGAPMNAVYNIPLILAFIVPLMRMGRKAMG